MSFPITCTACHKTFTISDEIYGKKVSGRVVTIKCKSCGQGIRVDGLKGAGTSAPAPAPAGASPAAATPPSEALWAVDYPDGEDREFTTAEVLAEIGREAVVGTTLVWREGMAEWLEVHQVPELSSELAKVEAKKKAAQAALAAAAAAAAAKAAPIHKPRAPMPTVTGLAGLPIGGLRPRPAQTPATAPGPAPAPAPAVELPKPRAAQPSAPELAKPRAQQPSAPELLKPRAAQPSAPELLKPRPAQPSAPELLKPRAPQPSAPELPKPRAQQPSAPDLPKPKPPAPPPPVAPPSPSAASVPTPSPLFAPIPLAEPTPPLPASVTQAFMRQQTPAAFPSAGASPLPLAAFGASPAVVAEAGVEWPQPKSKAPLIIGIVVALAAVAGAVLLLGGKQDAPPATAPITALPPAAAPTPTPTPVSPSTAADSVAQAPSTGATEGSDTATGSDPGATPGAGFAELFAAGARKAESKGAAMAPSGRFDAAATKAPLAEAASQAQACKQSGGPTGKVTVVVTFDPNGKASSATITEPPFAGTGTGSCIASALKRASIPPFSGLPGTVSKTFSIL